jgi:hypothetical protein
MVNIVIMLARLQYVVEHLVNFEGQCRLYEYLEDFRWYIQERNKCDPLSA